MPVYRHSWLDRCGGVECKGGERVALMAPEIDVTSVYRAADLQSTLPITCSLHVGWRIRFQVRHILIRYHCVRNNNVSNAMGGIW